jgi:uncharacterized protein (DUF1800 family)
MNLNDIQCAGVRVRRLANATLAALLVSVLAACGGGGGGDSQDSGPVASSGNGTGTSTGSSSGGSGGSTGGGSVTSPPIVPPAVELPASTADARRFLTQATFGPTEPEVDHLMKIGYSAWIDEQFAKPQKLHRAYWDAQNKAIKAVNPNSSAGQREVLDSFYQQALKGDDQLRQRVTFALSEIFVISMMADGLGGDKGQGVAGYLDMLGRNAFGNYRTLIEDVSRHPMMGIYLSHLRNAKEDPAKGRVPDENFAREVMQLFSIGLYELNADGSQKLDLEGKPIETYGPKDIAGMAKVFTGWSWDGPDTGDGRYYGWGADWSDPARLYTSMQGYTQFHSLSEKRFLGAKVVAQTRADPYASLKTAMDTLAAHPNVGPFLGKQLIQRLVTSNPSPAYVGRVAQAFGKGGDMKAMVRAVLLDPEARDAKIAAGKTYGKLREPVLRLTAMLRAFDATSDSAKFLIGTTDDAGSQLGQTPMRSPSVFNFYRPGYVPPNTKAGKAGLAVPEMQITHETTVAGYANYMIQGVMNGFGQNGVDWQAKRRDVQIDYKAELALVDKSEALAEQVLARLLGSTPNDALKAEIVAAVDSIKIPELRPDGSNKDWVENSRKFRVYAALSIALVAPEFLIQK